MEREEGEGTEGREGIRKNGKGREGRET